ncbi:putative MAS6-mitochondrial inner membrane import translocase subunit [Acaromyces ingoldii]|uniref:Putative MAS6-mitochondrial inner membrane import translocase subunit n=1 Tax=Acaromyces ingoldii TaxID=215250 RepID=A0A316YQE3_9BASI|nr:putative MAS6-mitochondrial inner membrane import translocase subunit [Acaromyces ingoldii]PWN90253.1 putative MAS6-mitochondrial inner membrane import translocase subunit [Acaromyces ingoldii]
MWPFSGSNQDAPAPAPSATEGVAPTYNSAGPSSAPQQQQQQQRQDGTATDYFQSSSAKFDRSQSPQYDPSYTPNTSDLFNNAAFDVARLHPMAGLGKDEIEYLDIVDAQPSTLEGGRTALPSRGWSDDLCYGTGTTYLSGLGVGGLLGAREGLFRPLGVQSPTFRLRLNAVLNQITRRGSFMGNSAGVLALIYNIFDASIDGMRGKHDIWGSIGAGGLSGALFKCTAGVRPMMISSSIMMGLAATWSTAKTALL